MNELKGWLSNAIFAALAAVFSILQEIWIGTEPKFLAFLALGSACGIALSFCVEMAKSVFWEHKWSWNDVITGGAIGVFVAVIMCFACA